MLSGAPLTTGQLPAGLLGFMPHMSTEVGNTAFFFHSSYMTVAAQEGLRVNQYDMGVDGYRANRVNVDTLYGLKQLDDLRVATLS